MDNHQNIKTLILRFFPSDFDNENILKLDSLNRELLFQNILNIDLEEKYNIIIKTKNKLEQKYNFFIYNSSKFPFGRTYIHLTFN
jgi:hypothetical protein